MQWKQIFFFWKDSKLFQEGITTQKDYSIAQVFSLKLAVKLDEYTISLIILFLHPPFFLMVQSLRKKAPFPKIFDAPH